MTLRVLVLGGTGEARSVADLLSRHTGIAVTTSLAGRLAEPRLPAGRLRVGGFGGADGLAAWLRTNAVDAVVDATHPFATVVTGNAARAAAHTGIPLVVLHRAPWAPLPGDRWHDAADLAQAAGAVPALGRRAFLTIGRQGVSAFAGVHAVWFLVRAIESPDPPVPAQSRLLLQRGPFNVEEERNLMRANRIDLVITKNSGGPATRAKLDAARELQVPVLMVARPPLPAGVQTVPTAEAAVDWVGAIAR